MASLLGSSQQQQPQPVPPVDPNDLLKRMLNGGSLTQEEGNTLMRTLTNGQSPQQVQKSIPDMWKAVNPMDFKR